MELILPIIFFVVGLVLLIKGGDWFVDGASALARRFHLPEILIGATVVSIGTTLPEVMVSAGGALSGSGAMAYGNAIGSIICNTALIAAITIAIKPSKADRAAMIIPVSFFFIAAAFYVTVAYALGTFPLWSGIVLLCLFVIYMVLTVVRMKTNPTMDEPHIEEESENVEEDNGEKLPFWQEVWAEVQGKRTSVLREILLLVVGAAVIAVGARLLVDNGTFIAETLGVPETVISLTFVALGTSLPELVTAITSLMKGHGALSLGNIIGANLFNLVLVSGVSITLSPFDVPVDATIGGMNASFVLDIPVMLGVMLLLTVPTLIRGKLSRWQGIGLLVIYAAFVAMQFVIPFIA